MEEIRHAILPFELNGNKVNIAADICALSSEGNVFAGWLVDVETDYKLSLGEVNENGKLSFSQDMVNPTCNVLVITEEPDDDTDPNAATPIAASELQSPFGL